MSFLPIEFCPQLAHSKASGGDALPSSAEHAMKTIRVIIVLLLIFVSGVPGATPGGLFVIRDDHPRAAMEAKQQNRPILVWAPW